MSASLTEAAICGKLRSLSVMNALPVLLLEVLDELEELEPVGPPPIHWPTAPLRLAIVPSAGATSVAAARLFWAVCNPACAPETEAAAESRSIWVGGARVCDALAACVRSAA